MLQVLLIGVMTMTCVPEYENGCGHPAEDAGWHSAGYLWSDKVKRPEELGEENTAGYLWSDKVQQPEELEDDTIAVPWVWMD